MIKNNVASVEAAAPVPMPDVYSSSSIEDSDLMHVPVEAPMINSQLKEALRKRLDSIKRKPVPVQVLGTQVNDNSGPLKVAKIGDPESDTIAIKVRKDIYMCLRKQRLCRRILRHSQTIVIIP